MSDPDITAEVVARLQLSGVDPSNVDIGFVADRLVELRAGLAAVHE